MPTDNNAAKRIFGRRTCLFLGWIAIYFHNLIGAFRSAERRIITMPKIVSVGELKDYTIIENACLRDMSLDIAERGLLVTMLSLPNNWDFSGIGLTSILPCDKSKVFSTLKKLEKAGYLKRERIYIDGKITDWEYRIYGRPIFKEDACRENDSENINDENVDNPSLSVDNSAKNVDNISNSVDNYVDNFKNNTMRLYSNSENNATSVSDLFSENLEVENRYDNKIYNNQSINQILYHHAELLYRLRYIHLKCPALQPLPRVCVLCGLLLPGLCCPCSNQERMSRQIR